MAQTHPPAGTSSTTLRGEYEALERAASDSVGRVREKLNEMYHSSQDKMMTMEKRVEGSIQHHPFRALLIAAGVGFVVGWFKTHQRS